MNTIFVFSARSVFLLGVILAAALISLLHFRTTVWVAGLKIEVPPDCHAVSDHAVICPGCKMNWLEVEANQIQSTMRLRFLIAKKTLVAFTKRQVTGTFQNKPCQLFHCTYKKRGTTYHAIWFWLDGEKKSTFIQMDFGSQTPSEEVLPPKLAHALDWR